MYSSKKKKTSLHNDGDKFNFLSANSEPTMSVRQDITILPAEAPNTPHRLGWIVFESEEEHQKWIKEKEDEDALKDYLYRNHPSRRLETDKADIYRVRHHVKFQEPSRTSCCTIQILSDLYGQPYNNETINRLVSFRPSYVRVSSQGVTLDSCPWRITIDLEDDDITIRSISQEVSVGAYGHGEYKDVSENEPSLRAAVVNDYAISKITVE